MAWGSDHMNENDVESVFDEYEPLDRTRRAEELRRRGAYHEAAHAVVDVVLGHTVRYVSIETEGTDYRDKCVTAILHMEFPGVGLIPFPGKRRATPSQLSPGIWRCAERLANPVHGTVGKRL